MAEPAMIRVQVCYALPAESFLAELTVAEGTTLAQAIQVSGLLQRYPSVDLATQRLGIFGKLKPADSVLRDGDRVEVYRPLLADPKETRRRRAQRKGVAAGR